MHPNRTVPLTALALMLAAGAQPARAGTTEPVSVRPDGATGAQGSFAPSLSTGGRFVAFYSFAPDLVPGDTNDEGDAFVRDRLNGTTERVSVGPGGRQGDGDTLDAVISGSGRFVAFATTSGNLVPGDTNGEFDVFVRDRLKGATTRVSVGPGGHQGNALSAGAAISAGGQFVAFWSDATNLVPGDTNGVSDVFVHDRQTGQTERVSLGPHGVQANGDSSAYGIALSRDGRYVAFGSTASNLVPGDTNGQACTNPPCVDLFVRDRKLGKTERVSVGPGGRQGDGDSLFPSISSGGRYIAFHSFATNLVPGNANGDGDVFVRDRQAGTTARVSLGPHGAQANGFSYGAAISADGRRVAFISEATNLVPGDTNGQTDVFVRDRQAGTTERVSVRPGGGQARLGGTDAAISADGQVAGFATFSPDVAARDANETIDVFVRTR